MNKLEEARYLVGDAIKKGLLVRPANCSECGRECRPMGHHDDYDKPLDVRWLCAKCHYGWHRHHLAAGAPERKLFSFKTHCKHGHLLDEENTTFYTNDRGFRVRRCRTCNRKTALTQFHKYGKFARKERRAALRQRKAS